MTRALLCLALAGCWSSAPPAASPQPTNTPTSAPADAAAPAPNPNARAGCIVDAAAKAACDARGPGFSYGPMAYFYCKGVAPRPGEEEAEFERIRTSPCACNDLAENARRREECSRIP